MRRLVFQRVTLVCYVLALGQVGCERAPTPVVADTAADTSFDVALEVFDVAQADTGPPPPSVSIATWNVRRFFDTVCDTGACEQGDYEEVPSAWGFDNRALSIADSVSKLSADIVLLQEIETAACLDAVHGYLADTYSFAHLGEIGSPASVDVGVMTRGEMLEVRTHRETPIASPAGGHVLFSRELLEVHIDLDGWRVVVFSAHFRSQFNDDPDRRLAEAMAARAIVTATAAEFPDALVVLGGDLNDTPGSPPLNALEEGGVLWRVASEMLPGMDWTYSYLNKELALDHLYMATQSQTNRFVPGSAAVIRYGGDGAFGGSDHAAVRATFERVP